MKLEQQVTVRLDWRDVDAMRRGRTLAVVCPCGQHLGLGWDGRAVPGAAKHKCPKCAKRFPTEAGVRMHRKRAHEGMGPGAPDKKR